MVSILQALVIRMFIINLTQNSRGGYLENIQSGEGKYLTSGNIHEP